MKDQKFIATFLYIKQHSKTGLLYFGKTIRNPEKYAGSGKHWLRHLKVHGKQHVKTLWYCLFLDQSSLVAFAETFSTSHNIIKSPAWANIIAENGLDGAATGHLPFWNPTEEERKQHGTKSKENWKRPEYRELMKLRDENRWSGIAKAKQSKYLKETHWTKERKLEHSTKMSGRPASDKFVDFTRAPRSEKHKSNISKSLSGLPKSKEHKEKLKGPKPKFVCPNCGKIVVPRTKALHTECKIEELILNNFTHAK